MRELGEILWSMPAAELLGIAARVTYVYLGFLAFCGVCL
jgi:hypothetical protein